MFILAILGVAVVALGVGLCIYKSRLFYVLVLVGSGWCSLVLWVYIQGVIEVAETTGLIRGMVYALPITFFVMLNAGAIASMGGKSEDSRGK